jgi:hypothetical protein
MLSTASACSGNLFNNGEINLYIKACMECWMTTRVSTRRGHPELANNLVPPKTDILLTFSGLGQCWKAFLKVHAQPRTVLESLC